MGWKGRGLHPRVDFKHSCAINAWVCALIVCVGSAAALIVLGVTIVKTRVEAEGFLPTNCSATRLSDRGSESCNCQGEGCRSTYPCKEVQAQYKDASGKLHQDVVVYQEPDQLGEKCSFSHCDESATTNNAKIAEYVAKYANASFECFYNPADFSEVYILRNTEILHHLLWPGLGFGLGLVVTLGLTSLCREGRRMSQAFYDEEDKQVRRGNNSVGQMPV